MVQVEVERLSHRGVGLARDASGKPVEVARSLPGERVEGAIEAGLIAAPRILVPSPDRVTPPCPQARRCGGCQLQHMRDDALASWKADRIRSALSDHGLSADIAGIETSPPGSRRRATISARRTRSGAVSGFHALRSDTIVPIGPCHLVTPAIAGAAPLAAELARVGASRKSALSVTATETDSGLDICVAGGRRPDRELRARLAELAAEADLARLVWAAEPLTRRPPHIRFGDVTVTLPPGAFLQATKDGERRLQTEVGRILDGCVSVADLFSGCGTFALPLARERRVHAVEGSAEMCNALAAAWRGARGLRQITTERRDLFRNPLSAAELARFDGLVIDPPRVGATRQIAEIAGSGVACLAYVSCHPGSFARDAARLVAAGYRMGPVLGIDQFRWSAHVELVAAFRLEEPS